MNRKQQIFYIVNITFCLLLSSQFLFGQQFTDGFEFNRKSQKTFGLDFELVNNLIVIPAKINNSDTLKFILDTGVKNTILSDLTNINNGIEFNNAKKILIKGLGEGEPLSAYLTKNNLFELPGIYDNNHNIVILENDVFHFTSSLGIQVNGIIGYEYFKNFVVEISYSQKKIYLHSLNKKTPKRFDKYTEVPVNIIKGKPYINAVVLQKKNDNDVKLLIDSGASSALSIFKTAKHISPPINSFRDLLGVGLSGEVYGETGRLPKLKISEFSFSELIATFPDETSVRSDLLVDNRHGSIGGEILKRFSVVYNYSKSKILLKPNNEYKKKFSYNMSGLEIRTPVTGIPVYKIAKVRKNSIGDKVGFKKGDHIVKINGIFTNSVTFNDLTMYFQGKRGKRIKLTVIRDGETFTKVFHLKDELKLAELEKKSNKEHLVARESEN